MFTNQIVPLALLLAALPAISYLAIFQLLSLYEIGDIPISIPNYAIAGVIYADWCERQGFWICSKGTAAGAGAVFAVIASNATGPFALIYVLLTGFRMMSEFWRVWIKDEWPSMSDEPSGWFAVPPGAKKSPAGSILFGLPESPDQLLLGPKFKISREELTDAVKAEQEELSRHPEMQNVFLSRPVGLDKKTHYVLVIGDRKYELRLHGGDQNPNVEKEKDEPELRYNTDLVAIHTCEPKARERPLDTIHKRRLFNPKTQVYAKNDFDVLLVGWTTATAEEIDHICTNTMGKWVYRHFLNTSTSGNCQNFVRIVADQICRQDPLAPYAPSSPSQDCDAATQRYHASNWDWFMHDVYGPIQQAQYNRRRANFWAESYVPLSVVRLRSPLEAGNEIIRFMGRLQQWTSCNSLY
ncbi:hypothetical protein FB567DRAFT_48644 [Paraphoma chrysanthemicola]|uniref:Uncharacterized protein n=1 Tax=Paraphoma chrysanthemicola TaxID=798071 RepID=A0A8K0RIN6_9PLEO|nr:hypothetical protein FB567DRAFT_48644 [Paraphoma chrysanthemicola]